jgi:hypothetical protein
VGEYGRLIHGNSLVQYCHREAADYYQNTSYVPTRSFFISLLSSLGTHPARVA